MRSDITKLKVDFATALGLVLALGGIVGGLILEKGNIRDVAQLTAAMIVLGGTAGAVLVTTPSPALKAAVSQMKLVFFEPAHDRSRLIEDLISYATRARRNGIVSLESDAVAIKDRFLRKALHLAIDGTDFDELKSMMELDIDLAQHHAEESAAILESGGGYAPTIGIIGAVLGLIQVMKNLSNIEEVGHGIAVAFVATVYGVGLANIFLLPAAAKVKNRARADRQTRELMLLGVLGILEGLNPKMLRNKLNSYLAHPGADALSAKGSKRAARAA
jgi:chemotaxis protein MotA